MTAAPLKLERGRVYVTPTGRRCMWRQSPRSDEPIEQLEFFYLGTGRLVRNGNGGVNFSEPDGFTLTPVQAQRLLRQEGAR